jgi:hypothetical protein
MTPGGEPSSATNVDQESSLHRIKLPLPANRHHSQKASAAPPPTVNDRWALVVRVRPSPSRATRGQRTALPFAAWRRVDRALPPFVAILQGPGTPWATPPPLRPA